MIEKAINAEKKVFISYDDLVRSELRARSNGRAIYIFYRDLNTGILLNTEIRNLTMGQLIDLMTYSRFYEAAA